MILNLVYLLVGLIIGFLVKHELDIKYRKKRAKARMGAIATRVSSSNDTLATIKELNVNLREVSKK